MRHRRTTGDRMAGITELDASSRFELAGGRLIELDREAARCLAAALLGGPDEAVEQRMGAVWA